MTFNNFYVISVTKMKNNSKTGCQRTRTGFWF